jgi:hypothetical protein
MQLFSLPVRIGKTDFPWGWQNTHLAVTSKIYKKPLKKKCSRRESKGAEPGWGRARAPLEKAPIVVLGKKWRNEEILKIRMISMFFQSLVSIEVFGSSL